MDERQKLIDDIDSIGNEIKDMIKLMGSPGTLQQQLHCITRYLLI